MPRAINTGNGYGGLRFSPHLELQWWRRHAASGFARGVIRRGERSRTQGIGAWPSCGGSANASRIATTGGAGEIRPPLCFRRLGRQLPSDLANSHQERCLFCNSRPGRAIHITTAHQQRPPEGTLHVSSIRRIVTLVACALGFALRRSRWDPGLRRPRAPSTGRPSRSASPAATGPSTPATATTAVCSSARRPGRPKPECHRASCEEIRSPKTFCAPRASALAVLR